MVEIEDENDGRPKVTENQTNHVETEKSGSRNIIYYVTTVAET